MRIGKSLYFKRSWVGKMVYDGQAGHFSDGITGNNREPEVFTRLTDF
jgi:hypothetical protein